MYYWIPQQDGWLVSPLGHIVEIHGGSAGWEAEIWRSLEPCWLTGWLAGWLNDWDLEHCARIGSYDRC